jgi:hypothetical protein
MAGYGADDSFADWLEANGIVLPDDAPAPAVLRQKGSAYTDATYGARFKGEPTGGFAQERAWPRTGARVGGSVVPSDVVPQAVIEASYLAAVQVASDPASLSGVSSDAERIKSLKAGSAAIEYQDATQVASSDPFAPSAATPTLSLVDGMLAPYLIVYVPGLSILSVGC